MITLEEIKVRYSDPEDRPEPGTCCDTMKLIYPLRHWMAVVREVWTSSGTVMPHCAHCGSPVEE